jgi:hypothetical protein
MKKYALIVFMMLSMRGMAAEKPGLWDAIKEAGKGIVWMIRVEVCKIDMTLFSKEGLNMFYANYKCYHKDHNTIYQTK